MSGPGESVDDTALVLNAVRMAIQSCRATEDAIRRDWAYAKEFGTDAQLAHEFDLLVLANEATNRYLGLLDRLEQA